LRVYLERRNMETVEALGGTPYIPFKTNTVEPKDDSIWAKMYHLFMYNREAFMFHYHKRSNAESAFSSMKQKFGDAVRSKSEVGQVNEVLAKCLCHNVCVLIRAARELGVETTFGAGSGDEPKLFI
jgi:transposase